MYKNISPLFTLFFILILSLFFPIQADAWWLGGAVYTDDTETTLIGDNRTIRLKINGAGDYTYETASGGAFG
ncbi:unnamed protein product [marine sediment metagenome]|uniref:Uncharacterized protein n=1 Tax=marine sediment metagenome TaxID=412755 RepID=X1V0X9_9ZZZZ